MTTPMLHIVPKTIVAIGESTDIVKTGSEVGAELESVASDLEDKG
jgi:hypothetical protein